jgi:RNA polymerase sigma-70 factor (ECF subfamily)
MDFVFREGGNKLASSPVFNVWAFGGLRVDDSNQCTADQHVLNERNRRFQQMALPHLDAAYNLARWLCGNANDADDVVQESYLRAFRFFDTFHGDSMRPWLLAIVRRTWYTEWRRRASSQEVQPFEDAELGDEPAERTVEGWSCAIEDPQTLLIRSEDVRLVHLALEKLPVEFREVLILRELEDMSYRDIAAIADLPIGTVMSRLGRGRRKLAVVLQALQASGSGQGARPRPTEPHQTPRAAPIAGQPDA